MKIGIIDDDVSFSTQLKNKIKTSLYFEDAEIVVFNEKFETLDLMDYEYLFMDIMLLQTSGIGLAKKVKNKQTKIIFVSANEALVYDCFDIHLYFFIRKAFYEEDFKRLLLKIEKDEAESNKQYLLDEKNHQYIRCVDIYYIQSHRNVCTFYTKDQEFQQYTTLKKCTEYFCSNIAFYKINSYTIINFKYVTKINHQSVTLLNQQTFNVSRKAKDLIEKYHTYRRYIQ
ncbi:response regulator [Coprobacillus sp. AF13-15]|jgi:DNA-binding LytR/AlgR family response regulator|nr:response regulator [Coprobacillus sp. AF13-4LB]RHS13068.1 response regulator [Coprobacillus sp. AF13-25]RHS13377.1 response regulator [Coprobacillus sp. AF13-15]